MIEARARRYLRPAYDGRPTTSRAVTVAVANVRPADRLSDKHHDLWPGSLQISRLRPCRRAAQSHVLVARDVTDPSALAVSVSYSGSSGSGVAAASSGCRSAMPRSSTIVCVASITCSIGMASRARCHAGRGRPSCRDGRCRDADHDRDCTPGGGVEPNVDELAERTSTRAYDPGSCHVVDGKATQAGRADITADVEPHDEHGAGARDSRSLRRHFRA